MQRVFGIDYRTLALFRIFFGLVILANLINLFPWVSEFYSDQGILPRAAAIAWSGSDRWSILLAFGHPLTVKALFLGAMLVSLAFIFGYRTRVATVLLWAFMLSVIHRNAVIIQGGDQLLVLLLFWAMFLPLGATFSIDAALEPEHDQRKGDKVHYTAATLAILVQASYVYWVGAILKEGPDWVSDSTSVYFAMHLDSFATPLGVWIRQFPTLLTGLTNYVLWLEFLMPVMMFSPVWRLPLRLIGLATLISMHLGFIAFLHIGLFFAISISSLLLFVPSEVWDWIKTRRAARSKGAITIYYDENCGFCYKTCLILREFCLPASTVILPVQKNPETRPLFEQHFSWVVIDEDANPHIKWDAVALILRRSVVFRPIGWLFSVWPFTHLGNGIYRLITVNRDFMGVLSTRFLSRREIGRELGRAASVVVLVAAGFVFYWNVLSMPGVNAQAPQLVRQGMRMLSLDQRWSMFAPRPTRADGWIVIDATMEDGSKLDLFTGEPGPVSFDKPRYVVFHYPDYRWRKYFSRFWQEGRTEVRRNYARHLCRTNNRDVAEGERLHTFQIYYLQETTQPDYAGNTLRRMHLTSWRCY